MLFGCCHLQHFFCQKLSPKSPTELPKHVHLDCLQMILYFQRPSSFPNFDFESTYVLGFDPVNQLLHQVAVPMLAEEESKPDDTCPWLDAPSDEILY